MSEHRGSDLRTADVMKSVMQVSRCRTLDAARARVRRHHPADDRGDVQEPAPPPATATSTSGCRPNCAPRGCPPDVETPDRRSRTLLSEVMGSSHGRAGAWSTAPRRPLRRGQSAPRQRAQGPRGRPGSSAPAPSAMPTVGDTATCGRTWPPAPSRRHARPVRDDVARSPREPALRRPDPRSQPGRVDAPSSSSVAGVRAPAFVERSATGSGHPHPDPSVAGGCVQKCAQLSLTVPGAG